MAKIKVNVTLDEELLKRIDDYADENFMNRSGLLSLASTQFLSQAEATRAIKEIAACFRKIADTGVVDDETQQQLEGFSALAKMLSVQ